ncbi:MAG TPA: MFS transporter [Acidimicrobiales bacterium]|nr:MFS transporter [Acidimicrobiales bacterium]
MRVDTGAAGVVTAADRDPGESPAQVSGSFASGGLVWFMAVATGAIVANLYYAQPLLHQISRTFHSGAGATSLVVTSAQAGYAAALVFVLPLGDRHPRRLLLPALYGLSVAGLVVCAWSPSLWVFELAVLATGLATVGAQVMVPFAADLSTSARRGRVVARLMTGLLVGILLARTLAGVVADLFGWRAIYWVSAALMAVFAVVLRLVLPEERPRAAMPYRRLVTGSVRLFLAEPVLRRRAWYGATVFGSFSVLWTALAFLLSGPPYRYSSLVIGLFGLAGVGGVVAATYAGKLADARRTQLVTALAALLTAGSFAALVAGRTSLAALLAGVVVLDVGVEGMHVTNQTLIYEVAPEARSRVNSAYMTCFFAGGAVSSGLAGAVYAAAGWTGVCGLGGGLGVLAMAMAVVDRVRPVARPQGAPEHGPGFAQ